MKTTARMVLIGASLSALACAEPSSPDGAARRLVRSGPTPGTLKWLVMNGCPVSALPCLPDDESHPAADRAAALRAATDRYVFETITTPGDAGQTAFGISSRGDIVGNYVADARVFAPSGYLLRQGVLAFFDPPGSLFTRPASVTDNGDIAGHFFDGSTGRGRGFVLHAGSYSYVDYPGAQLTEALAMNARGEIAGDFGTEDGSWHAYVLRESLFQPIVLPGMDSFVRGINARGDMIGNWDGGPDDYGHGFLLTGNEVETFDVPGSLGTAGMGINNHGQAVGSYLGADFHNHGFLKTGDSYQTVDFPGARQVVLQGINDAGVIVGFCFLPHDPFPHGFVARPARADSP